MARARTLWEEGRDPGRLIVALGITVALAAVVLDLLINREITWLFDIVFVVTCVTMALRVRPKDFFSIGVLPPLLMLGIFVMLGVASPGVIADSRDGTVQAVVTGLAHHSGALITGYGLCLGSLAMRQHVYRRRREAAAARRAAAVRAQVPQPRAAAQPRPSDQPRHEQLSEHSTPEPAYEPGAVDSASYRTGSV